jgi:HEAT repeat protein
MEVKHALRRAELPLVAALERVLLGLESDVVARALMPELATPQTRVMAASLLGQIGHTSAREPLLKALQASGAGPGDGFKFRFAAAEALVKLKGPEGKKAIPTLIEALHPAHRDQNILAFERLRALTGFTHGYKLFAADDDKIESQKKWQEWWEKHGDTFEFPEAKPGR